jgi:hypothetical protein
MRPLLLALALAQPLPFSTGWTDTGLIRADDDWSGVPGVEARRGDGLVTAPGADPRSVLADGAATPPDVQANEADPRAFGLAAGVAEFELANPVVALKGSATADAPHLVLALDTRGRRSLRARLQLRDVDAAPHADARQSVALQYRLGASEPFATVASVADATTGPAQATQVTPVDATLPHAASDRPLVQLRVLTTDAEGTDEWVGVDDVAVTGVPCGPCRAAPAPPRTPTPPAHPAGDRSAPALAGLRVVPRRVPHRGAARLRLRLSEEATVAVSVARRTRRIRLPAGPSRPRLPVRRLRPGAYRVAAVAIDLAGNRSATRRARLTIVRPRRRGGRARARGAPPRRASGSRACAGCCARACRRSAD